MGAPHFRARVTFRRAEDGGRRSPAFSGYRPILNFEPWQSFHVHGGQLAFIGVDACPPGATCVADVELVDPESLLVALRVGLTVQLHEGARLVADAEVVAVFNPPG